LDSGELNIERQCARDPDTCQTTGLTLRMVLSRPTVKKRELSLKRGLRG